MPFLGAVFAFLINNAVVLGSAASVVTIVSEGESAYIRGREIIEQRRREEDASRTPTMPGQAQPKEEM